jgi:REP element-mobilizing transposase RayT
VPRLLSRGTDGQRLQKITMEFFKNELYHIYNRGNNRQKIFFKPDNYIYFLKKVRRYLLPYCDILSYSLMPNHFHFLIHSDERTIINKTIRFQPKNVLSEGIRVLLSSYTQAINKQNQTSGSLFQQNTKAQPIVKGSRNYDITVFHYIHQNPYRANLVLRMEDWEYSSFADYCGKRNGSLCNRELAIKLLGLNMKTFYEDSYKAIGIDDINYIL